MPNPFFSISIPVFKTEAFLEQCLVSIQNQEFKDFECLVVNDGSLGVNQLDFKAKQDLDFVPKVDFSKIDGPSQISYIFDRLVGKDSRFRLIDKTNGGVSTARNAGLNQARGDWLIQIDPDDWILPNHLTNFHQAIQSYKGHKLAIPKFVLTEFYNTKNIINYYIPKKITIANNIHSCSFINHCYAINMSLVRKYNLQFDEKLGRGAPLEIRISNGGEDFLFSHFYLQAAESKYGKNGFEIIDMPANTYKYREIEVNKKQIEDDYGPFQYAKYFQHIGYQNPNLNVKIITFLMPFWTKLRFYKNPLATTLRKIISLLFRVIS